MTRPSKKSGIAVASILSLLLAACRSNFSAQRVFNRSIEAGKGALAEDRGYIFSEIAQSQAKRGFYDDALQTLRLVDKYPDQLFVTLVTIRAENGDMTGATNMAESAIDQGTRWQAEQSIAIIRAGDGQLDVARVILRGLPSPYQQPVLQSIGEFQAEHGDLEGALRTASEMQAGWNDEVLFSVADKLRKRGDAARAKQIEERIHNSEMAATAGVTRRSVQLGPPDPCDLAPADVASAAIALKKIEGKDCDCMTVAYLYDAAANTKAADRSMRSCPNPADVSAGMAELAQRSAQRGDVDAALRFAGEVHVTGAYFEEGYLAPALRDIAHAIAKKRGTDVAIKWAEARPTNFERAMALLGVAEAISLPINSRDHPENAPPPPPARTVLKR